MSFGTVCCVLLFAVSMTQVVAQPPPVTCPIVPCEKGNALYHCTSGLTNTVQTLYFTLDQGGNEVQFFNFEYPEEEDPYPPEGDGGSSNHCSTQAEWDQVENDILTLSTFEGCSPVPVPAPVNVPQEFDDDENPAVDDDNGSTLCNFDQCPYFSNTSKNFFELDWSSSCKQFFAKPFEETLNTAGFQFNYGNWTCEEQLYASGDDDNNNLCHLVPCLSTAESYVCSSPKRPGSRFSLIFYYQDGVGRVAFRLLKKDSADQVVGCVTKGYWNPLPNQQISFGHFDNCGVDDDDLFPDDDAGNCHLRSCPVIQAPPTNEVALQLLWDNTDCSSFVAVWNQGYQEDINLSTFVYDPMVCKRQPKAGSSSSSSSSGSSPSAPSPPAPSGPTPVSAASSNASSIIVAVIFVTIALLI